MRIVVATLALLATVSEVAADTVAELEARTLFKEGNRRLEAGEFSDALDLYRAAYSRFPSPKILLNLGTVLRQLARHAEAIETYEKYLADPTSDPARNAEVESALSELRKRVGTLKVDVNEPDARVLIDGRVRGEARAVGVICLDAGSHAVVAEKEGFGTAATTVAIVSGEERVVTLTIVRPNVAPALVVTPPREPAPVSSESTSVVVRSPPSFYKTWWFWAGAGALVAGSVAVAFVVSSGEEQSALPLPESADEPVRGSWGQ